jgi:hypothetical protein
MLLLCPFKIEVAGSKFNSIIYNKLIVILKEHKNDISLHLNIIPHIKTLKGFDGLDSSRLKTDIWRNKSWLNLYLFDG